MTSVASLDAVIREELAEAADGKVESVDVRDAFTLEPLGDTLSGPAVVLLAVRFGSVLLIDQRVIGKV